MITETVNQRIASRVQYLKPVRFSSAAGATAELYQQIKTDFMPAPLLLLHSAAPELLAGVWSILRETLLVGEKAGRAVKEIVAAAVSKNNECSYCLEAHTLLLRSTSGHEVADAILRGDYDNIEDPELRSMFNWALTTKTARTVEPLPFESRQWPQIIGTMVTFQYINRMVKLFLGDTLLPVPSAITGLTRRLYTATEGKKVIRQLEPGESLKFVPVAQLPADLDWASGNAQVSTAFAGFADVVYRAGRETLSEQVRSLVSDYASAWNGESMGEDYGWVDDAIARVEVEHRAAARLALMTALSIEVQPQAVTDFQLQFPEDAQLVAATAWSSFTAARRAGSWLAAGVSEIRREQ
jgi:AhpD family alkylhydroperoxidase